MRAKKTPTPKKPKPCKLILTGKPDLRIIAGEGRIEIVYRPVKPELEDRLELLRD